MDALREKHYIGDAGTQFGDKWMHRTGVTFESVWEEAGYNVRYLPNGTEMIEKTSGKAITEHTEQVSDVKASHTIWNPAATCTVNRPAGTPSNYVLAWSKAQKAGEEFLFPGDTVSGLGAQGQTVDLYAVWTEDGNRRH